MKTYDEMTAAVLRRRDAYKRNLAVRRRVAAVCGAVCLLTAVAVAVRPASLAVLPPTDGSSAPPDTTPVTKPMESRLYLSAGGQGTLLENGISLPTAYTLAVTDIRGLTEAEVEATYQLEQKSTQELVEQADQIIAHASTLRRENVIVSLVRLGTIELEIDDPTKVASISGKTVTDYGRVEFFYQSDAIPKEEYGPYSGNEMTLSGDYYQILVQEQQNGTGRLEINWRPSSLLYDTIDQNPDLPLSTFRDTFFLCVEYKDGTYENHLIEIAFGDDGVADLQYQPGEPYTVEGEKE